MPTDSLVRTAGGQIHSRAHVVFLSISLFGLIDSCSCHAVNIVPLFCCSEVLMIYFSLLIPESHTLMKPSFFLSSCLDMSVLFRK